MIVQARREPCIRRGGHQIRVDLYSDTSDGHEFRAVVRRVGFPHHRVHARPVVVRASARRCCQAHRFAGAGRCGRRRHRAIVRRWTAAVDGIAGRIGGHSLRVGSARELASSQRKAPASPSYSRRADGSRRPRRGSTSGAKRPHAGLWARRRNKVGRLGGVFPRG